MNSYRDQLERTSRRIPKPGTLGPAVRYADEYNTFGAELDELRERKRRLDEACEQAGRDPATIRFTLMTTFAVGDAGLRRVNQLLGRDGPPPPSWIAGNVDKIVEQLREYAHAGLDGVYLQHLVHEDLDAVEVIGRQLAPALA